MNLLSRLLRTALSALTGGRAGARTPGEGRGARGEGRGKPAQVRGKYDAATTSDENRAHWSQADGMSANAANSPAVRQVLRNRSRYEAQNNGYCRGLLRTRRNDVVGTGPRLQVTLPASFSAVDPDFGVPVAADVPAGAASAVEAKWAEWCDAVGLASKLRVLVETGDRDGECFAVLTTNPALPGIGPQLDLRLFEADQVTTPDLWWHDPHAIDGIRFDPSGNPVEYHFLRAHPGDAVATGGLLYDRIPARAVIHWFDADRPNQARGVPALAAALPLYAQLRRYTLATLTAAEVAAMISGVMQSNLPPAYQDPPADGAASAQPTFDRVEMERGALLSLPPGWEAKGFDAAQPVTGYGEFKREVLTETGAALNVPRNISTKSSADYNYSSARLDHLPYRADNAIARDNLARLALDRLVRAWLREAVLVPGYLPAGLPPVALWAWTWQWDGNPSIDPLKDANADDVGLRNGTRSLSDVLAERGKNWEEHLRQRAREISLARELERENGLAPGTLYPLAPAEQKPTTAPEEEAADAEPATAA